MNRPSSSSATDTHAQGIGGVHPITLGKLRSKMARNDDFVFVMALDRRRFNTAHIDGSISFDDFLEIESSLRPDTEIVLYCTSSDCVASRLRAAYLSENGFSNVYRYAGGLAEWVDNGLPIITNHLQRA